MNSPENHRDSREKQWGFTTRSPCLWVDRESTSPLAKDGQGALTLDHPTPCIRAAKGWREVPPPGLRNERQRVGSATRPANRIRPVWTSRTKNKNGRSASKVTGSDGTPPARPIITAVAAAASVPVSSISTKAL